jgi:proteasome activator subunit 4
VLLLETVTELGCQTLDQKDSPSNIDRLTFKMAEKEDDLASQTSSTSALHPVVDPTKPALVEPGSRPVHSLTPTQTTMDDEPRVKDGYNYWSHLPYSVEDEATRIEYLNEIITDLYACIKAGDLEGGARTASRQIKRWLHLKFKMPKDTRRKLIKLYYDLSLTPGLDPSATDTFSNMFRLLASYASLLFIFNCRPRKMPANELTLDWRPLYDELYRNFIRSNADPPVNDAIGKGKDLNHLTRLARYAQKYFPASEIPAILEKVLPEVISTGT